MLEEIVGGLLVIAVAALLVALRYIQSLRAQLRARWERLDPEHDPGQLDDVGLREALRGGALPASKTLDRVQDAFERLLREKKR